MGGGLGGKQSTQTTVPAWLEDAARGLMGRADQISRVGYVPYYGPDVAAMTPDQLAAQDMNRSAAAAFGMPVPPAPGLPPPQTFAGGVQGYSSGGLFDQAKAELQARAPGQFDLLAGQFVNPATGAMPGAAPAPAPAAPAARPAPPVDPRAVSMTQLRASGASSRDLRRAWAAKSNAR